MNESYIGNDYNAAKGELAGDHLRTVRNVSLRTLITRANNLTASCDRKLAQDDLPHTVRNAITDSQKLASQLEKCESVPIDVCEKYVAKQMSIASAVLPALVARLQALEREAVEGVDQLRRALLGKAGSPGAQAACKALLDSIGAERAVDSELALPAWRAVCAVCKEVAEGRGVPRYLAGLRRMHVAAVAMAPQ